MFFSVIIPTFKRRESLSLCLNHLAATAQTFPSDLFEVIVTDDALADMPADSLVEDSVGAPSSRSAKRTGLQS
jgi:GT2 family glycosyltransferase